VKRLGNILAVTYLGAIAYLVTEPYHYEIGVAIDNTKEHFYRTWSNGQFYMQAKIELFLLT
jgi:hypothetical protein